MKSAQIIFLGFISFAHINCGQEETNGYEKIETTIDFFATPSDTTIRKTQYDVKGNQNEQLPKFITEPDRIDTIQISDSERIIEHVWPDKSKSVTKEINTSNYLVKIGIDRNGIDTIYYSKFELGRIGRPLNGIVINHGDSTKYEVNETFSIEELNEIHSVLNSESEFITFRGVIRIHDREQISISDIEEPRNSVTLKLNEQLKPTVALKREWHEYHQKVFENRYSYKYEDNRLIEIRNRDEDGDLEMIRTIEYIVK